MPTLAKRLKKFREQRNLSMRETAKLVGVPETTYREWEYGRAIRGEPYGKIAQALGVSLEDLFGLKDNSPGTLERDIDRLITRLQDFKATLNKVRPA